MTDSRAAFKMLAFRLQRVELEAIRPLSGSDSFSVDISSSLEEQIRDSHGEEINDDQIWNCVVECGIEFKETDTPPFKLKLGATGVFSTNEQLAGDRELWMRVMRTQAPALVYSQLRPPVRVLMGEAGYTQFILPVVNFYAEATEKQESLSIPDDKQ